LRNFRCWNDWRDRLLGYTQGYCQYTQKTSTRAADWANFDTKNWPKSRQMPFWRPYFHKIHQQPIREEHQRKKLICNHFILYKNRKKSTIPFSFFRFKLFFKPSRFALEWLTNIACWFFLISSQKKYNNTINEKLIEKNKKRIAIHRFVAVSIQN